MADGERSPDPREARSPAEFIALLAALKDWSGLTYRELSARAEAVGDVLPRSTVANMLSRTTVPREELLTAFVRACGAGPEALESWLVVRKELAARGRFEAACAKEAAEEPAGYQAGGGTTGGDTSGAEWAEGAPDAGEARTEGRPGSGRTDEAGAGPCWPTTPTPGPGSGSGRGRSGKPRLLVALIAVAALVIAVVSVVAHVGEEPPAKGGGAEGGRTAGAARPPVAPASGFVAIRAVHSGLCLNERPGSREGQVYQVRCEGAVVPQYALERLDGGRWRIVSHHPEFGPGCSGIPAEARLPGGPLQDSECGQRGDAEAFRIEPFGTPVRGYLLRPTHTGLCVAVVGGDLKAQWARLEQARCTQDGAGQLFSFDPKAVDPAKKPAA